MVKVFVPKEVIAGETRIAATPETVDKLVGAELTVVVQTGAGAGAYIEDAAFQQVGAQLARDATAAYRDADVVLKVREPAIDPVTDRSECEVLKPGAVWVSLLSPLEQLPSVRKLVDHKISCFSMNLIPRITRAQKMDALSSQSNIAGYKAALIAAAELPKFFPLLMTAAGTVKPAKVVVMGAGVAGLQAIATAKRIGAQVWASDVRLAAKEQVESLGGKFIDVPGMEDLEDASGYAKQATAEFLTLQRKIVGEHVADADAVITTALVPGRQAPVLISSEEVARMRPGSVIVDLAAEQGGNCAETVAGQTVVRHGVRIIGPQNLPSSLSVHASELYARNMLAFFLTMVKDGALNLDFADEVLAESVVTHQGEVRHAPTAEALAQQAQAQGGHSG